MILNIILFVLALMTLAYLRASLLVFTLLTALLLADLLSSLHIGVLIEATLFGIIMGFLAFMNITPLRQKILSAPIYAFLKKVLPSISRTEREAIDAGDTWWERDLMSGKPQYKHLLDLPAPTLTPEEQAFMDGPVNELCAMINDWEITYVYNDLPKPVWSFIKNNGFFGLIIPKNYGGLDFSAYAHSEIIAKIASKSVSAAVTVSVPNSLGPAELLIKYGTEQQKDYYLPRLAKGDEIPCFALTSPVAGSDAGSIPDIGVVCKGNFEGKNIIGIRLNWDKRYITLAPVATLLGLAFKLHDPEHLIGETEDYGITCALIPTHTAGITIGRRHLPLNVSFQNGPTQGKDVFIPLDYIIGGQAMAGHGWQMLMECLSAGRAISLPSTASGPTAGIASATGAYARIRQQFKLPIGYFEGVEAVLARIGGYAYIAEATRVMTAAAIDLDLKPAIAGAISKYHVTELGRKISLDAMDIHGGKAICMGPHNYTARFYQAMPIAITVEGANILTRNMIIFGQGALRCHPYLLKEMMACQETDYQKGLHEFDHVFWGHAGYIISNLCRTVMLSFTHAYITHPPVPSSVKRYYQHITRLSAALAITTDMTMGILGGALKRKENLSARLGDVLSYLYLASAVLKRYQDQGNQKEDLILVDWAARYCLNQAEFALHEFYMNFPYRILGTVMNFLVFPYGRRITMPNDKMSHRVARMLMSPNDTRTRLSQAAYMKNDGHNLLGQLEDTLLKCIAVEPIDRKIHHAIKNGVLPEDHGHDIYEQALKAGIISDLEKEEAEAALKARMNVINVDDFPGQTTLD